MAAYAMMGCYDARPRVRPNTGRTVTVPNASPVAARTTQAAPAHPNHLPTVPFPSHIDNDQPQLQESTLVQNHGSSGDSLPPLAGPVTTCLAWHPEDANSLGPDLCMSAGTTGRTAVPHLERISPMTICTINRDTYTTINDLCLHLQTHGLFHTVTDTNSVAVLCINNLRPFEYDELSKLLAPLLESFRIHIDFQNATLIMRRPSQTHESGATGWSTLIDLVKAQMPMPAALKYDITWNKGQPDVTLPPLSTGGLRIKCPDACLGPVGEDIPTLVLETGYSQTPGELHIVAKAWLHRLIKDEMAPLEDHAVQCIILFKINENLSKKWLPAFRESLERQDFDLNRDLAPNASTFLSDAVLQTIALTVEIWRNESDASTGALKRERTVRNRPTSTIPVCISRHDITTSQLFDTWIWQYLSDFRNKSNSTFQELQKLQDQPQIPRSTISTDSQNKYITLYLDDLISPKDIEQDLRGTIWINLPIKLWVWGYLRSQRVGSSGWKGQVAHDVKDIWAEWRSRIKEKRNAIRETENDRSVLGELEVENEQICMKRSVSGASTARDALLRDEAFYTERLGYEIAEPRPSDLPSPLHTQDNGTTARSATKEDIALRNARRAFSTRYA
ncbi:hypothetical protein EV426DRAFT_578657 [Tirmania nivea]|nr:hypothetical protein EV426DRAFT_578657 [Tirmania nivea]